MWWRIFIIYEYGREWFSPISMGVKEKKNHISRPFFPWAFKANKDILLKSFVSSLFWLLGWKQQTFTECLSSLLRHCLLLSGIKPSWIIQQRAIHSLSVASSVTERFLLPFPLKALRRLKYCLIIYANRQMNYIKLKLVLAFFMRKEKWIYEQRTEKYFTQSESTSFSSFNLIFNWWMTEFSCSFFSTWQTFSSTFHPYWLFMQKLWMLSLLTEKKKKLQLFLRLSHFLWKKKKIIKINNHENKNLWARKETEFSSHKKPYQKVGGGWINVEN